MQAPNGNFENRQAKALMKCQASIKWYEKNKKTPRNLYYAAQVATIVLSALTPVLILITDLPKWAQALPAALAAIAASLNNVFHWQEHWIRRASTLEVLEAELLKYETRTSSAYEVKLDEQQALNNFVGATTNFNLQEVSNWGKTWANKTEKDG